MDEYISREAIKQVLCGIANGLSVEETKAFKTKGVKALYKMQGAKEILNAIDNDLSFIPATDVQPVKRGRWIEKSEDYYSQWQDSGRSWDDMPYFITGEHFACGVCFDKYEINAEGVEFWDFCPHCGADMRGGAENDD